ncbi:Hypothetical protein NTJ_15862 [Nesidiocoris tenuis]|uniref:Gustatory receptor n=1 Tax=Nesidiocoris tenuis TaxID=355587 RepID=A0ABN7BFI3_9HEMI|nr:Hypothetical protein NTJ_15862 [Nesidiocoris tenuis]
MLSYTKNSAHNQPILTVSRFAGVFPFRPNGDRSLILSLWSMLVVCTIVPVSISLASYQISSAFRSGGPDKSKQLLYTGIELFKSLLFGSSLLVHVYVTTKYRYAFKSVIAKMTAQNTKRVGTWDLILGSSMAFLRFLLILFALTKAGNQTDVYVLRSNSLINTIYWLNYLIIFQLISFIRIVGNYQHIWKQRSLFKIIAVNRHSWIVGVISRIIDLYSRQLLIITLQSTYAATTSIYYLTTNLLLSGSDNMELLVMSFHSIDILSLLLSSYQMFVLATACEVGKDKVSWKNP